MPRFAHLTFALGLASLAACGSSSSSGNDGKYLHLTVASSTASMGCPAATAGGTTVTVTNEGSLIELAIYPGPGGAYILDTGGFLLQGTASGSTYAFKGVVTDTSKVVGSGDVVTTQTSTWNLTLAGTAVTGTAVVDVAVNCDPSSGPCTGFQNTDCTQTGTLQGSVLPGIDYVTTVGP